MRYLLDLAVEGSQETLSLLILSLETRQHQRQERLLTQERHTEREKKTVILDNSIIHVHYHDKLHY